MSHELTVLEAIEKRRSIKHFKNDPIPDTVLHALVDAATEAPSSWNLQPWRIVLVTSPKVKRDLANATWNQPQITEAPAIFIFAVSIHGWKETRQQVLETAKGLGAWGEGAVNMFETKMPGFHENLKDRAREFAVKDAVIAATHVALAAESLGLGTCFMNGWVEDAVKKTIGAANQPDTAIALILPVGYPAETAKHPGRLPKKQTVFADNLFTPYQFKPAHLRSPREMGMGLMHLPRLIDKVRLHSQGHLPGYHYLTAGFDKYLLEKLGVSALAFREAVKAAPDDTAVYKWLEENAKNLSTAEKKAFNDHILSIGSSDPKRAARFRCLLDTADPSRTEINSFVDLIDLLEGRI